MAFKGDPFPKRMIQAVIAPLGYKIVRAQPYDARMGDRTPPNAAFNKIFCIGFNKTATTSVERVLRDCGLKMPKQLEQEEFLEDVIASGDYQKLRAFCADYAAFQDLPFSQSTTYIACDALFPRSKFILTFRNTKAWVDSYIRFYKREFGLDGIEVFDEDIFKNRNLYIKRGYVHKYLEVLLTEHRAGLPVVRWDLAFDRDFLSEIYERRNSEIRSYFSHRPNDLFCMNISEEKDTGRLMQFLNLDGCDPVPYPRENANAT